MVSGFRSPPVFPNQFTIQNLNLQKISVLGYGGGGKQRLQVQVELLFNLAHSSLHFADFQFLILSQLISFGLKSFLTFSAFLFFNKKFPLRESKIDLFDFWIGDKKTFDLILIFRVVGSEFGLFVNYVIGKFSKIKVEKCR